MQIQLSDISKVPKVDLDQWAKYTVEKFEFAVAKYNLRETGDLLNSFQYSVAQDAGGNNALISFAFEYYLRMIDMGVGKGTTLDNKSELRAEARAYGGKVRRAKPVYNKIFWAQLNRLNELLQEYYLNSAKKIIVTGLD